MKRFTALTITTLALLTACTNTTATPTTTTVVTTTTLAPTTTVTPATTLPPTTLAPVTTKAPSTTKPKTTITGNRDKDYAGARAMLAKVHENFYRDGDVISLGAGFDSIESRYAAYSAKVGTTLTGYYITLSGSKTCYLAHRDDPGIIDTAC